MLEFFKLITHFGDAYFIIGAAILSAIFIKDKNKALSIFVNLLLVFGLNQSLKHIFKMPRPSNPLIEIGGYSFPSGHSMIGLAFYGFLIYLIFQKTDNKKIRILSAIILSLLIILIGASRVYLKVHYLKDVLCGFVFALIYLVLYIKIINKNIIKGR